VENHQEFRLDLIGVQARVTCDYARQRCGADQFGHLDGQLNVFVRRKTPLERQLTPSYPRVCIGEPHVYEGTRVL